MHELSIAQSLVESVRSELAARGNPRLSRVGVRVGELSGVQGDALQFAFEMVVKDTDLAQATLDVEEVPLRHACAACGHEFPVVAYDTTCPACGGADTRPTAGDELQLSYLEVE